MGLPIINLSLIPTFPARVFGAGPVTVDKSGLDYVFNWDITTYSENPSPNSTALLLSYDPATGATELITIDQAIFTLFGAAFKVWFNSLPKDPTPLASGDIWNNGGTVAQVP